MRNLKITLEYEGTCYSGWQIQSYHVTKSARYKVKTIQETVEKVLRKILQEKVRLIASGRTDAGVHALGQVANFKTGSKIPLEKLQRALNGLLPKDISVISIEEASPDFHSRFCAKSKIYRYSILNRPHRSALLRNNVYFYSCPVNIKLIRQEAKSLLGKHDFKAFCASGSVIKNTRRTVKKITVRRNAGLITVDIEADGFLYNMVRNIVGTLVEIGRGKFSEGSIKRVLGLKNRKLAGPTAPACGLALLKVKY